MVVVADNGGVKVYGAGKIDLDGGEPFVSREEAARLANRWRAEGVLGASVYTRKILGNEPSDPVSFPG